MKYTLVSGDSHVDLSWLPGDLFSTNAPGHLKDRVPRIIERDGGPTWMAGETILGASQAAGHGFTAPSRGRGQRMDRMLDAGFYDGQPHPTDPDLRLKHMSMDGLDGEILYGITGTGMRILDTEIVAAVYQIYNDWVSEFCNSYPGKWYALACIPIHDPQLAAQELRRAAGLGPLRGADLIASEVSVPIYSRDGYWDPLWQAVAETQMPVAFHLGGARLPVPTPVNTEPSDNGPSQNDHAYSAVTATLGQLSGAQFLVSIILGGACERFPDFKFVMGECGAGWVPFALDRMDHIYKDGQYAEKFTQPLSLKPSDYWFRQGHTTFQEEPGVGLMAHLVGVDNLMWGSDYPHPDGVWPDSKEVIRETMGKLSPEDLRKITCDNAVNLYRMGQ
jgi:predicted TIM-barrel fold metal-dependent hydrolase